MYKQSNQPRVGLFWGASLCGGGVLGLNQIDGFPKQFEWETASILVGLPEVRGICSPASQSGLSRNASRFVVFHSFYQSDLVWRRVAGWNVKENKHFGKQDLYGLLDV